MAHHSMRRKEKEVREPAEIASVVKRGRYATLALCRDGEPYAVTLNYGFDAERNALYFHCAAEGQKIDFIRANPAACGTVIEDRGYRAGKCKHAYRTVVFHGKASVVSGIDEKKHAMRVLVEHLEPEPARILDKVLGDEKALSEVCVLRLDIEHITAKQGS